MDGGECAWLGHTNIRTTEKFMDSFEREVKRDLVGNLTAFKKKAVPEVVNDPS